MLSTAHTRTTSCLIQTLFDSNKIIIDSLRIEVEGYEELTKETRESLKRLGIELGAYANSTVKEVFEANGFTLEKARPR